MDLAIEGYSEDPLLPLLAQMYLLHFWDPCEGSFQGSLSSKSYCPRPLPGLWNLLTPPKSLQQTRFWPVLQGTQGHPPLRTVPSCQSGEGTFAQGGDSSFVTRGRVGIMRYPAYHVTATQPLNEN